MEGIADIESQGVPAPSYWRGHRPPERLEVTLYR